MVTDKPIDRWLGLGSVVVGFLLFLFGKTGPVVVICVIAMFGLLVHPIWNFWWIEETLARRIGSLIVLAGILILVGDLAWPKKAQADADQAAASSQPTPATEAGPGPPPPTVPIEQRAELRFLSARMFLNAQRVECVLRMQSAGPKQVLPNAQIYTAVTVRPEVLDAKGEDGLFAPEGISPTERAFYYGGNTGPGNVYEPGERFEYRGTSGWLAQNVWEDLLAGKRFVYLSIDMLYRDEYGLVRSQVCRRYVPPDFPDPFQCRGHNFRKAIDEGALNVSDLSDQSR